MRRYWTPEDDALMWEHYPTSTTQQIMAMLNRSKTSVYSRALTLGIKKTDEYMRQHVYTLTPETGKASRFKKGQTPPNKGKRQTEFLTAEGIERSAKTRFKKGAQPHNTLPVGTEILKRNEYYMVKTGHKKWEHKSHLVWQQHHGPVPEGCVVKHIDGNRLNNNIDNLKVITLAENMLNNTIVRYPANMRKTFRSLSTLKRLINEKTGKHRRA